MIQIVGVAVNAPINGLLSYSIDKDEVVTLGTSVWVPLGSRVVTGVVVEIADSTQQQMTIKSIVSVIADRPALTNSSLKWAMWMAKYYFHPPGMVLETCFLPLRKKSKKPRKISNSIPLPDGGSAHSLNLEQAEIAKNISAASGFQVHLIHGITGSGKTEVYLRLFEDCLKRGKQGMFLVPEISLTPQLLKRFSNHFTGQLAVFHSQLTPNEREFQWDAMMTGKAQILLGARSALFCPIPALGLIILDEEHEPSFKQDEKLKYHARDAAIMKGKLLDIPIVLGSATPSLETYFAAKEGRYSYHSLPHRVGGRSLPEVYVVDLKDKANANKDLPFWLSQPLYLDIQAELLKGKQSVLFLNRRGIASAVTCTNCGDTRMCPNCDISLTLHGAHSLVCHYCDFQERHTDNCQVCHDGVSQPLGLGTERIVDDLQTLFPQAKIARADRDEISHRDDFSQLVEKMEAKEIDILVGTQMIAKGLDFKHLNLVGVVLADIGFHLPDFRASERSFHLITQVAGRAGRHLNEQESPSKVFIQTFNPDHPAISFAANHNYVDFAQSEIEHRKALNYPPFGRIASLRLTGSTSELADTLSRLCKSRALALQSKFPDYLKVQILGPTQAGVFKMRNQFRYQIFLKCADWQILNSFIGVLLGNQKWVPAKCRILVDVDPYNLL